MSDYRRNSVSGGTYFFTIVAARVQDWPWSTFHRFVEQGEYDLAGGGIDPCPGYETPEWNDDL